MAKIGIFGGIKGAKASLDALYFVPGLYWCRIDKMKVDKNRKNIGFCATETTIVKVLDDNEGRALKAGMTPSHLIMQDSDYFLGEVKALIANVMGLSQDQVEEEHAEQIYGPEQPFAGMVVEIRARNIVTKNNTDFTKITYVREVPATELIERLTEEEKERFFPGGVLEELAAAAAEADEAAEATSPA